MKILTAFALTPFAFIFFAIAVVAFLIAAPLCLVYSFVSEPEPEF